MNEVATVSVHTVVMIFKTTTFFCLVLRVVLVVFTELIKPMSELTLFFVRTIAMIHVLFAELRLLFVHLTLRRALA
jgi:hypothetical protein